ncbi:fibronectin type III domain-containing protein [Klenkia brasiliensis]|nr:fibronectin type III domain-containing protein [Klenkia brasiliensis]
MRSSIVSRRVLGLAAAALVGLSTAALPGVALAEEGDTTPPAVTTSPVAEPTADPTAAAEDEVLPAVVLAPTGGEYFVGDGYILLTVEGASSSDLEYSLDNGSTWTYVDATLDTDDETVAYGDVEADSAPQGVQVRNVDGADRSAGTALDLVVPVGAPTNLTAVPGGSSLTVDWDAPAPGGTYAVSGYEVYISQVDGEGGGIGCSTEAPTTACTFPVPDGYAYDVYVLAYDEAGYTGGDAFVTSAKVPAVAAPTAVPTKDDGDITGPSGPITAVTAGQQLVLKGDGFFPGTTVRLTVFSAAVDLGSVVVADDGTFTAGVTIPATLANGTHHLVATGIAADGSVRNLVITVTVSGGQATVVPTLANTGFDAVPVAVGGGLVLLTGAGLLVGARRRSNA